MDTEGYLLQFTVRCIRTYRNMYTVHSEGLNKETKKQEILPIGFRGYYDLCDFWITIGLPILALLRFQVNFSSFQGGAVSYFKLSFFV